MEFANTWIWLAPLTISNAALCWHIMNHQPPDLWRSAVNGGMELDWQSDQIAAGRNSMFKVRARIGCPIVSAIWCNSNIKWLLIFLGFYSTYLVLIIFKNVFYLPIIISLELIFLCKEKGRKFYTNKSDTLATLNTSLSTLCPLSTYLPPRWVGSFVGCCV